MSAKPNSSLFLPAAIGTTLNSDNYCNIAFGIESIGVIQAFLTVYRLEVVWRLVNTKAFFFVHILCLYNR